MTTNLGDKFKMTILRIASFFDGPESVAPSDTAREFISKNPDFPYNPEKYVVEDYNKVDSYYKK